jgi:hypothetical protein
MRKFDMSKLDMTKELKGEDGLIVVTDEKSRELTLKEPDFLQEARITRLCGEASTNVGYMYAYVFPSIWVARIDDNPVPFPTTFLQLEALISRVGREGCSVVIKHMKNLRSAQTHEGGVKN